MKDLAAFLDHFVVPLLGGGKVHVAAPIDRRRVAAWAATMAGPAVARARAAVETIRAARAAELVVRPGPLSLSEDELRLVAALHNALVLSHPQVEAWTTPTRIRRRIVEVSLEMAALLPPTDRPGLISRHTILGRLFEIVRFDTQITWWTGRAEFRGTPPPRRLTAWPGARRVRVEQEVVRAEILLGGEATVIMGRLLEASPLTDLLEPVRAAPRLSLGSGGSVFRDAELSRAVAYAWLGRGREHLDAVAAAAMGAWERLLVSDSSPADVRAATAFLVHVTGLVALDGVQALEPSSQRGELGLLFAVPDLAREVEPELAAPPGLERDGQTERYFRARCAAGRAVLGESRFRQLASRLSARWGPR